MVGHSVSRLEKNLHPDKMAFNVTNSGFEVSLKGTLMLVVSPTHIGVWSVTQEKYLWRVNF